MRAFALAAAVVVFCLPVRAVEHTVRGRVILGEDVAVADADVGTRWVAGDGFQGPDDWRLTDDDGHFEVTSRRPADQTIPVMARNPVGTHVGLVLVGPDDVERPVTVSLEPAVTLQGHAVCSEIGRRPARIHVEVEVVPDSFPAQPVNVGTTENLPLETLAAIDDAAVRLYEITSYEAEFSLALPPGRYWLRCYAADVEDAYRFVKLDSGQPGLDLGALEMPLTPLAKLYGKAAPEWHISEARGLDQAARLSDLRGKWVLLEFWGHWCGPCVTGSLPRLAEFYRERSKDRDRFEIVAVHYRDADTLDELDEKLAPIQEKYWDGKPLPFPIIVDATDETVNAYGINSFPTAVLVDPEGKVSRVRSAGQLGEILDGKLIPGENRAVDDPAKHPEPPSPTPLAADHIKVGDYIRCEGHTQYATSVRFSRNGNVFVTAGSDTRLIVWDAESGRQQRVQQLIAGITFTSQGVPAEILPGGEAILSIHYQTRETGWFRTVASYAVEVLGTEEVHALSPPPLARWRNSPAHSLSVDELALSANGKLLAMSQWDDSQNTYLVTAWDLGTGLQRLAWHGDVRELAVSPEGRFVVVGEGGHTQRPTKVRAFDTQAGEPAWEHGQTGWSIADVAFSNDGKRMACAAWDEMIAVRDAGSGDIVQTLRQPGHRATAVAFSPDGRWLATGGAWPFRSVRLWDLNAGTLRATLLGHNESEVKDIAFSPDGRKLVSVGGRMGDHLDPDPTAGEVYLWDLDALLPR